MKSLRRSHLTVNKLVRIFVRMTYWPSFYDIDGSDLTVMPVAAACLGIDHGAYDCGELMEPTAVHIDDRRKTHHIERLSRLTGSTCAVLHTATAQASLSAVAAPAPFAYLSSIYCLPFTFTRVYPMTRFLREIQIAPTYIFSNVPHFLSPLKISIVIWFASSDIKGK